MIPRNRAPVALSVLALLAAASSCRGCLCNAAKSIGETAPDDVVIDAAKRELGRSPAKLKQLCGAPVAELKDLVVTVVKASWARHEVRVRGTAVPLLDAGTSEEDDADDPQSDIVDGEAEQDAAKGDGALRAARPRVADASSGDGGARATPIAIHDAGTSEGERARLVLAASGALVCTGVFALVIHAALDERGNRTRWDVASFDLDSVETPGVTLDKAAPNGGSGHRRRRHHH